MQTTTGILVGVTAALAVAVGCSSSSNGGSGGDAGGGSPGSDAATTKHGSGSGSGSSPGSGSGSSAPPPAGDAGGTVGGVPGGVAGVGTTISGCEIFPTDNPWNVAIDGPSVQVIHTYDAQLPQGTNLHPDWGGYTSNTGGIPYNLVPATQPEVFTEFVAYAGESDPGPSGWIGTNPVTTGASMGETKYPFFIGMKIEGNPAPGGTAGNLPGDQHGIVLQQGASGCTSYEAWNCVVSSSLPIQCANGAVFDLTSNTLRTAGWTSADAAGLPILPGLVKLSEVVTAKVVTHAVRMTFNTTQQGYIAPATHAAGSQPLGSAYPPMGLRLRMKASVDTSSYTAASQVVMAGLKKYGLIVADNGSDWFFQGDSNDGWNAMAPDGQDTLIDEIVGDFRNITGADFEAVDTGTPVATGL